MEHNYISFESLLSLIIAVKSTGTDVIGACEDTDEMANMYNEFLEEIRKQKEKVLSPFSTNRIR